MVKFSSSGSSLVEVLYVLVFGIGVVLDNNCFFALFFFDVAPVYFSVTGASRLCTVQL